jgi:tRNA dimethylallyltransferase
MQCVPHQLYGHVSAAEPYSVARWLTDVAPVIANCRASGLCPVIVGGTGLYFTALLEGLSPVPPVPDELRDHWRALAATAEPGELSRRLRAMDPEMAERLDPADTQRLTRALEVVAATGRSLADWQRQRGHPLVNAAEAERMVVQRPRAEIHARCDQRLEAMVEEGALDEVARLLALGLPSDAPAMRALGVPQFAAHLRGACSLDAALAAAKLATRQYVKRQETWLRHRMPDWDRV